MKRLSNKKYLVTPILWTLVAIWAIALAFALIGCAKPYSRGVTGPKEAAPFCQRWNTMGDEDGGEDITPGQRKMFHLGHWLVKEDFVRITLNQHYGENDLLVDLAVTCYTEHAMFLVEETDGICKCSEEDKSEQVLKAFNDYINDCVREAEREAKKK